MAQTVKNLLAMQETGFYPWVGKIPWRREWQPTPVFLAREFHGQRSLVGYSLKSCKELGITERLTQSSFYVTAAAKSLQSCPTLCNPTDVSPLGSTIPGILQARTLEWVAISFVILEKSK